MQRVLVIEDETVLRSNVARGIGKLGVEVLEASNLNDGLRLIDQKPPNVVVSDIDMPERSGLELLGELGRRGLKVPVIFVSGYLNAYRAQIPHHASVEVLEKPVPIEELREVVLRRLGAQGTTDPAPFSVPDYLQLACLGRHSVIVEVERNGELAGEVVVAKGDIWSASDAKGTGLHALGRLAFAPGGGARVRRLSGDAPPRNLEGGWEYLLMEAARVMDEHGRENASKESALELDWDDEEGWPAPSQETPVAAPPVAVAPEPEPERPSPNVDPAALAFEAAWEQGIDALLSKDYSGALIAFTRASELRPGDPKVALNLKRLRELGYPGSANP